MIKPNKKVSFETHIIDTKYKILSISKNKGKLKLEIDGKDIIVNWKNRNNIKKNIKNKIAKKLNIHKIQVKIVFMNVDYHGIRLKIVIINNELMDMLNSLKNHLNN